MIDPDDRARIEKLESAIEVLRATVVSQALAGDVTGSTLASVLSKIQALAGGGTQFVAVDNAGVITTAVPPAPPADYPMAGDVTGTTAASVLSMIAALAGAGTQLVAVDNAGNIVSAGAPPSGGPTYVDVTHDIAPGATVNFDVDLVAYPDSLVLIETRILATTKAGTANLTGVACIFDDGVFERKGAGASLALVAGGGNYNPMNSAPEMLKIHPQACDVDLVSGGFAPMNSSIAAVGGASTVVRLQVTNQNAANTANVTAKFTLWIKAA